MTPSAGTDEWGRLICRGKPENSCFPLFSAVFLIPAESGVPSLPFRQFWPERPEHRFPFDFRTFWPLNRMKQDVSWKTAVFHCFSAVFRRLGSVQAAPRVSSAPSCGKCTERCTSRIQLGVRNVPFPGKQSICSKGFQRSCFLRKTAVFRLFSGQRTLQKSQPAVFSALQGRKAGFNNVLFTVSCRPFSRTL